MVNTAKLMRKKEDGTDEQYYPQTHIAAVLGLSEFLKNISGNSSGRFGVSSINGKDGVVFITQKDLGIVLATGTNDGLLSKEMYQKIQEMSDNPSGSTTDSDLSVELAEDNIFKMLYQDNQFYPQTIIEAVEGLTEALTESGIKGEKGDPVEQGPPGTAENLTIATEENDGLMSSSDKIQINRLSKYSFEKTGEI
ncbi:hypothetical protein [Lactococcus raffinolactis]|uniref:hypothetical protein n=1 Tax=Pseudolactococcus raffinolactis TaxID=1366 RepID=UPI0034CE0DD5